MVKLTLSLLYVAILYLFAILTLMVGVLHDVDEREVNSYLFVPLFLVSAGFYAAFNFNPVFIGVSAAFFVLTFFNLKPVPYIASGAVFIAVGFLIGPGEYILYFLILFLMYIMGTGEKYYGIGDIKAFISVSFASFSSIPALISFSGVPVAGIIPFDFVFLVNTALMSALFIPYLVIVNLRRSGKFHAHHLYALDYDEKLYNEHPERYRIAEYPDKKIMVYGAPSLLAIYIGYLITIALGPWFLYL